MPATITTRYDATVRAALACLLALAFTTSFAAEDTLARVKRTETIRLGYLEASPPFSFVEKDHTPQGYSVDLCKKVVDGIRQQLRLGDLKISWVPVTLKDRIEAVRAGRVDLECGTTTASLSRQEVVDFSLTTFVDGASMVVKVGAELNRLADFGGKRIAVVPGTTTEKALRAALNRRSLKTEIILVDTREKGLALLNAGDVDAFASDRVVLLGLALTSQTSGGYKLLSEDFSFEPYALAMRRNDADFRLAVNRVLAGLYRSADIEPIYARWFGDLGSPSLLLAAMYFLQSVPE